MASTIAHKFSSTILTLEPFSTNCATGWRKLIFRRWKIVYTVRGDAIIIGRIWPAAMGGADMETPL